MSDIHLSDLPWVDAGGERRYLANLAPPDDAVRGAWPLFGSTPACPIIPREEWAKLVPDGDGPDDPYALPVHDQNGAGMCNCSATAAAIESARAKAGLSYVALSGGDLYQRISGGVDRGSMLEDGLAESMRGGVAPVSVTPYLQWRRRGVGAEAAAMAFRVVEAWLCPTFDACYSAILQGFDLISGIMWRNNFKPDGNGWLPDGGSGGGGHAVMGYKPTRQGSRYGIWHKNSWTVAFGLQGRCVFPEAVYGRSIGGWWAVRVVTTEPGDIPAPRFQ